MADAARAHAHAILAAGLAAVAPRAALARHLRREGDALLADGVAYDLRAHARVLVVGAGKASAEMAAAVEDLLGPHATAGLVITKDGHAVPTRRVAVREASHPLPDARGVAATAALRALLDGAGERDLVLVLLSGGGSALLEQPADGLTLGDLQATTEALLRAGATINELNAVRKHLSAVKGGNLARAAAPATVLVLVLSDVVGNPLDVIASGPCAPDPTTYADALAVLARYQLAEAVPPAVRAHLAAGARGERPETPKPGDPLFAQVQHVIIGDNAQAAAACVAEAERRGLRALLLSTFVEGEAREVGRVLGALARELRVHGRPLAPPACLILGGETTVTVRGPGRGGRNQEVALGAAWALAGLPDVLVVSAATDGGDGPTDAAGACVDGTTLARAAGLGLDPRAHLARNDAYPFFQALGDLLVTGPTRTNVNDLLLVLAL
jgi:hydroxypyruvate reductase